MDTEIYGQHTAQVLRLFDALPELNAEQWKTLGASPVAAALETMLDDYDLYEALERGDATVLASMRASNDAHKALDGLERVLTERAWENAPADAWRAAFHEAQLTAGAGRRSFEFVSLSVIALVVQDLIDPDLVRDVVTAWQGVGVALDAAEQ
ncbi:hypothetical protein DNL40_02235 [Xylanimonas oleitrophica]|uniref:Uncharacterized protein n=2 Tax=Xylanimonas oleitrophica TaxID=2607479 RepID=A0A2W5WUQ7_9MICO|nr:hypothetical protein DNL40_02235 [Xylanimonas oleitrophica]